MRFVFFLMLQLYVFFFFFFFNDTATTEIYTLSLHDALPISPFLLGELSRKSCKCSSKSAILCSVRSEEHTSELQSLAYLVCRLLLEKKKKVNKHTHTTQHEKPTMPVQDTSIVIAVNEMQSTT